MLREWKTCSLGLFLSLQMQNLRLSPNFPSQQVFQRKCVSFVCLDMLSVNNRNDDHVFHAFYRTVFLCQRMADRKFVIIKQIPVEAMTKEERQAALNEVKVLSMLDHPYIIEYYENFLEDKALMIVMEYAQG